MAKDPHFAALERMYLGAPINAFYRPAIQIGDGEATIEIEVTEKLHHAAGAVHGSVYFKMLDDAAYFAANSLEREKFVLTAAFTVYLTRPVVSGKIRSVGKVFHRGKTQFLAEAVAYDAEGREIGRGSGVFARGKSPLSRVPGYDA